MKCPLIKIVEQVASATLEVGVRDCLKEECAWWDETFETCDPTGLTHTLERLADALNALLSKSGG